MSKERIKKIISIGLTLAVLFIYGGDDIEDWLK